MTASSPDTAPHLHALSPNDADVRRIWTQLTHGVIGSKGAFSGPRNVENLAALVIDACELSPTGAPIRGSKWVATSEILLYGATSFLTRLAMA